MAKKDGKRKKDDKRTKDQKNEASPIGAFKFESVGAPRKGHVMWVGHVPPSLCASELIVRDLFSEYGMLLSVTIHHNFVDMSTNGFMYLEYSSKQEAEDAVAAVVAKQVGRGDHEQFKIKNSVSPDTLLAMEATLAMNRGEPRVDVDEGIKDLLLGRRQMNRFSQQNVNDGLDEEDLMLQSLSQHSFSHSQPRKKRRKSSKKSSKERN
ncbi:hypothetical protein BBO99_00004911 [Phytophthora kernoviae]|uniref:RRM domain-containing protein n=2 Tax=Phytophthora kernoviae TaxID=325452 RepID=A0A421EV53_9STRA|nr:hypothetical protein G195_009533 [Phytophthora kernoviae 00238/432]KAG2524410.1 hypothetical protein JM16_004986 [Phytophthora kernoviae]KAG2526096.1 hypothetical protein JM18_004225 [Phytophthora kernoviae]RLN02813.1 hypothetical protein BBI17_005013 [Phytophthora kernoviae]RLN79936.1 hypothetical protein BBO99_00004911 [Phytophthora kernoviae]